MFPGKKWSRRIILIGISLMVLSTMSCMLSRHLWDAIVLGVKPLWKDVRGTKLWSGEVYKYIDEDDDEDDEENDGMASLADEGSSPSEQDQKDSNSSYGPLKPIGFVNHGDYDATVRADTYIPLGGAEAVTPPTASTISTANDGAGTWPNTSRFISVPMGAYSWCIEWEEGDVDDDGQIDYFHYIQDDPTVLDENDSDELEFAEEVAIMAPPSTAPILFGKCAVSAPYVWVEVGAGDYIGGDVGSSEGPLPDPSMAEPGITAICWDNDEFIHFSEKAFCTYKSVHWEECLDGPYKGRMYTTAENQQD